MLKLLQKFDDKKVLDYDINAHGDFCAEVVKMMDIMVGQVAEKKQAEADRLTKEKSECIEVLEEIGSAYDNGYVFNRRITVIKTLLNRIKK